MSFIDLKMAWRNIWRNPRRSILTVLAIAFATLLLVFMLSWQFGSYETMINVTVKRHTGHLQIQAEGYQDKKNIRLVVSEPDKVANIIRKIPGINHITFRASSFSIVSSQNRSYGTMVLGIDPLEENRVSTIKNLVRKGSYFSGMETNQTIVGRLLAKNLKVDLGDELVLLGQGRDGSIAATAVKVKGILDSGQDELDRRLVYLPLAFFQEVFVMGGAVHEVVVICRSLQQVPEINRRINIGIQAANLKDKLVVLDWKQLMPGLIEAIKMDLVSGFIFYIILIIVVAFSILNTFLMAIFERTREFGILMAMGVTPGRLTKLLLFESAGMTLLGVVIGIVAGSLITLYFQGHGIVIPGAGELLRQYGLPERMFPRLSLLSLTIGAGVVLLITLLTAMYPTLKVRRLSPLQAMTGL